jgi:hypothetical protein
VTLPAVYAEADDLVDYWRPLSQAEQDRAEILLGYAANLINELPGAADTNGDPVFSAATAKHVCLDMVKRAMIGGGGVSQSTQSMADMSASMTYTNPVGNLYLTNSERDRLFGYQTGGAFSLTLSSNARVPLQPWNYQQSSQTDAGN